MNREGTGDAIGYLWAVATAAAALTLQVLFGRFLDGPSLFLFFIPAVAVTAWMAGATPAIVATVFGIVSGAIALRATLLQGSVSDIAGILLFAVASGCVIGVLEGQHNQVERDTALRIGEKVAQAASAAANKLDRAALDNTWDIAIIFLDNQRCVKEWNVGASQLTGWHRNEMMGRSIDCLYPETGTADGQAKRQLVLAEVGGRLPISGKFLRKDGRQFHGEGTLRPIQDSDGFVSGFLLSLIDVTARVDAQEAIETRLKGRADELESLSYSMAHDMRQYTRGIANNARELRDIVSLDHNSEAVEILGRIEFNGKRMHEMVEGILEHTKLQRMELIAKPVDLSKIAESSAKQVTNQPEGHPMTFDIQPNMWVRGDAKLIEAALNNLFGNAAKYGANYVRFGFDPVKDAYFVGDDGPGFDPKYKDKVFGIFQRLHGQENPGTGMGLANVKMIVERHGGDIWAESEGPGKGATFYFTLKKVDDAPVGTPHLA